MKKILFVVCAFVCLAMASCTNCKGGDGQQNQDTIVVEDTTVVEVFDTLNVD